MAEDLRERIADRLFGQIHGQGITSPLLLADAVLDALGLEQIGGVAYCVMHDEMVIEGYDPMGECRRSDGCVEVPVYARLPLEEAHTVDVGHVHVLTTPGGPCASICPHPDHRTEETRDA